VFSGYKKKKSLKVTPQNGESVNHITNCSHQTLNSRNVSSLNLQSHEECLIRSSLQKKKQTQKENLPPPFFKMNPPLIPELPPRQRKGTRATDRLQYFIARAVKIRYSYGGCRIRCAKRYHMWLAFASTSHPKRCFYNFL
jgi:hypothetical protein